MYFCATRSVGQTLCILAYVRTLNECVPLIITVYCKLNFHQQISDEFDSKKCHK